MANEKRKRYRIKTTLGAALTSAATSVTFAAALTDVDGVAIPTLGTDEYIPLVIDPDNASEEIVYVTAFTTGGTTATIARGGATSIPAPDQTTAVAHNSGATVICGPTPGDLSHSAPAPGIDDLWGGSLGSDYEFEANSTALPTGWSWYNQLCSYNSTDATYTEGFGRASIWHPGGSAGNGYCLIGVQEALPASWSIATAKLRFMYPLTNGSTNISGGVGMFLSSAAGGAAVVLRCEDDTSASMFPAVGVDAYTSPTAQGTSPYGAQLVVGATGQLYMRIVKHSATSYDFDFSIDGLGWWTALAAYNVSTLFTPAYMGWGGYGYYQSYPLWLTCEWFRVR